MIPVVQKVPNLICRMMHDQEEHRHQRNLCDGGWNSSWN